jgi:cyclopropane-fatty-acyl-phospholipid synthase
MAQRIAIIGGGVSGLAAAWHLHTQSDPNSVDVHIFESEARLGGHAHTLTLDTEKFTSREYTNGTAAVAADDDNARDEEKKENGDEQNPNEVDIDVGFMVYNKGNYPNMTRWFESLGVQGEDTDMSLSVSLDGGKKEWSSHSLKGLFANPLQCIKPEFYTFLKDLLHFNANAGELLLLPPNHPKRQVNIQEYLTQEGYSEAFASYYLLPMMAALWSSSHEDVLAFPASSLVEFMCNHKMLQLFDRPQYQTPAGRSIQYTSKIAQMLGKNAHTNTPIVTLKKMVSTRDGDGIEYELFTNNNVSVGHFDHVVFACHSPQAVQILNTCKFTNPGLIAALEKVEYGENVVYVHSDATLMPKRKAAWGSWNCMGKSELLTTHLQKKSKKGREAMEGAASGFGNKLDHEVEEVEDGNNLEGENGRMRAVYVTYYINRLQNLTTSTDIFVSLNPHTAPRSDLVYRRQIMAHPQFNQRTHEGRADIKENFQGKDGLWFCGAYMGYGFHEDGCRAGFEVATAINGVALPWVKDVSAAESTDLLVLPPPDLAKITFEQNDTFYRRLKRLLTYRIPVAICKAFVTRFLQAAITKGQLVLKLNDGSELSFGDGTACGDDSFPVIARVFDDWFFVKVATEYDLGLARSYMAGQFLVEKLTKKEDYPWTLRTPKMDGVDTENEANDIIGDPIGLTRLFLLFVGNRDTSAIGLRSSKQHTYANALQNASGLAISKIGSLVNYLRFKIFMDNSERGGSLKNIHAHYDLSNDLFRTFLDKETLMYSSAIYDAVAPPPAIMGQPSSGLVFKGSLEEAQWRKLDTLCDRAQLQPGQTLLDIGFGWGGLSLHAAKKYGCHVTGITLSVEQKALAEERVEKEGLGHLINFEVIDYRTFARRKDNQGKFDRVISCEMIEAVGHEHLGEFFWAVEQVLKYDGVLVMEAITTPEARYETYLRSTDFINTVIFPGGICPSLHALVDASYKWSTLTLEHIDNIGLHYAETLAEWRRRFNANEAVVRKMGFDDVFMRVWNYYMTYCEAGFRSQTEHCLILVFSRPGNRALLPLSESRSVTQLKCLTKEEVETWIE